MYFELPGAKIDKKKNLSYKSDMVGVATVCPRKFCFGGDSHNLLSKTPE